MKLQHFEETVYLAQKTAESCYDMNCTMHEFVQISTDLAAAFIRLADSVRGYLAWESSTNEDTVRQILEEIES